MINLEKCESLEYRNAEKAKFSTTPLARFGLFVMMLAVLCFMLLREFVFGVVQSIRGVKKVPLEGQLCLVTGGANGLGKAIARKFAQKGCSIAIVDIASTENAVQELIEMYGVKCQGFHCDVSDSEAVELLKKDVQNALGSVDILVNNAGLNYISPLLSASLENIKKCISVNLTSHFMMVKCFLPGMIERRRGRIIAISSIAAKMSFPLASTYSATKFGVDGFMEALYDELCLDDHDEFIKLSTIFPYFINTRKEMGDLLDTMEDPTPRLTPEFVAREAVKHHLKGQRNIIITPLKIHRIIHLLPDRLRKYLKNNSVKISKVRQKYFK